MLKLNGAKERWYKENDKTSVFFDYEMVQYIGRLAKEGRIDL